MYVITRQMQWLNNENVVEISRGGLDYTNPDALCNKYDGEFEEISNPLDAVETAISIMEAWQKDCPNRKIYIAYGDTMGFTMPFEPCTIKELKEWAKKEYDTLDKCPVCGEITEELKEWYIAGIYGINYFYPYDYDNDKYCSEYCAKQESEYEFECLKCGKSDIFDYSVIGKIFSDDYVCEKCRKEEDIKE